MKILKIVALLVLVFLGVVFYLDVNTPPQPTRGQQIDSVGLREPHLLVSDPTDVASICEDIPDGKVAIRWVDSKGVEHQSMIPCSKIKIVGASIVPTGQTVFVFDQEWASGVPGWYLDCGDGIVTYLELSPRGELGRGCELMDLNQHKYTEKALSDPNNFLDGPWLVEVWVARP